MKHQLKISIIGLGNMGIGIYKRLSDRGFSVYAYDSNKSLLNSIPNDLVTNVDDILLTSDIVFFAVPSVLLIH
jgi:3-hydroxyisobutyrate dehydrogenase-like beta-hydroxyacid dehydrogenase